MLLVVFLTDGVDSDWTVHCHHVQLLWTEQIQSYSLLCVIDTVVCFPLFPCPSLVRGWTWQVLHRIKMIVCMCDNKLRNVRLLSHKVFVVEDGQSLLKNKEIMSNKC